MNPDKPHGRKRQSSKHLFHVHLVPDQILVVKYGAGIRVTETQTQIMIRKHLKDQVPVPEVFGWTEDEGQVFIYMLMIEGVTLQERWVSMSEDGRRVVCEELRDMVKGWRSLEQDGHEPYVRSLGQPPLNEIFLSDKSEIAGPFQGAKTVQQCQDACDIDINEDVPIVFKQDDIVPPNIILTSGPNPMVAVVIGWGQAG